MKLFLSPHNDDEVLWGSFTLMREKPLVVIVYDGYVQAKRGARITYTQRRQESCIAMNALGMPDPKFLGLRDDAMYTPGDIVFRLRSMVDVDQKFDAVYSPIYHNDGHDQHNVVALAAGMLHANTYPRYATYTRNGGKQRTAHEVLPLDGEMIRRKHTALACYESQYSMDVTVSLGCWPHFMDDIREYSE